MAERIQLWPVGRLVPYAKNARTHSPAQIAKVARSIREFGFTNPILVDGDAGIIAGHARLAAALEVGLTKVPVIELTHLSDAQRRAYILADNRLALDAGWDDAMLADELQALRSEGYDLELTGFSNEELAEIVAAGYDDAPPPPELELPAPVSRAADLWRLGDHRVLCGDATDPAAMARVLEGGLADAVWTDPPYNVAYEGAAGSIENDAMSDGDFLSFLRSTFAALVPAMRPGAPIYVAHPDTGGYAFRRCFLEAGLKLSSCLIWRKNALVLSRGDYHWQHEPILYGWKPGAGHRWFGLRDKSTMLEFDSPPFRQVGENEWQISLGEVTLVVRGKDLTVEPAHGSVFYEPRPSSSVEHPTMKPVALIARMLANSTDRGAVVLDPFGGSGSTLLACDGLGLRARLLELEPRFVDVIIRRWEGATQQRATLEGDGRTFDAIAAERAGPEQ